MIIGIDASRNRSGGAQAHLKGILDGTDPTRHGIEHVHLWAYQSLADAVPSAKWLTKHTPPVLDKSLLSQLSWQRFELASVARDLGCQVMFNTDAGSICTFKPSVTMSQDMLSFEPGEMKRYRGTKAWLRLLVLRYVQAWSLRRSTRALFLTRHAATTIQQEIGTINDFAIIPHGVDNVFRQGVPTDEWPTETTRPIKFLYISNAAFYKHQWHVVKAFGKFRKSIGREVELTLVGGGTGKPQAMLDEAMQETDPEGRFIQQLAFIPHHKIPNYLADADAFIFASSCENMPITLLEAMASGLPIACSDRGPMPEVLEDAGFYFDPEDTDSIETALCELTNNNTLRRSQAIKSRALSEQYTWPRCSEETWECVASVAKQHQESPNLPKQVA